MFKRFDLIASSLFILLIIYVSLVGSSILKTNNLQDYKFLVTSLLRVKIINNCEVSGPEIVEYIKDNPTGQPALQPVSSAIFIEPNLIKVVTKSTTRDLELALAPSITEQYPLDQKGQCIKITHLYDQPDFLIAASSSSKLYISAISMVYLSFCIFFIFFRREKSA